jgi:hypothetical protein
MKVTVPIYYTIEYKTKKNKTVLVWMNFYRNCHFMLSNKIKSSYHELIRNQIWDMRFEKIRTKYKVFMKTKRSDYHNIRSVIEKFFLDWLVENWNLKNDTMDYMLWDLWCEVFIDKDNPRMEIEIIRE